MNRDIVFHVGLHKTGTTWLQWKLFARLNDRRLVRESDLQRIHRMLENTGSERTIVSSEALSGTLRSSKRPGDNHCTLARSLEFIKTFFPEAKIVIGFREHHSWINSAYMDRLQKEYVSPNDYGNSFSTEDLKWYPMLKTC
jgi:hypothetical protein